MSGIFKTQGPKDRGGHQDRGRQHRPSWRWLAAAWVLSYVGGRRETRLPPIVFAATFLLSPLAMGAELHTILVLGACVAAVVWMTQRQIGGPVESAQEWAFRISVVPLACTMWLGLVNRFGFDVYTVDIGLAYVVACTALWLYLFASHHVGLKVTRQQLDRAWKTSRVGKALEGMRVVKRARTPFGEKLRLDITETGLSQQEVITNKNAASKLAAAKGLPAGRVQFTAVAGHAGQVDVTIRDRNPWVKEIPHPNAPGYPMVGRTIKKPIPVGQEPDGGKPMTVELFVPGMGGQHVKVFAATRGGKTTFYNSLVEHLTDCEDTEVVIIDLAKGKDARAWEPACKAAHYGPDEMKVAAAALVELRAAVKLIKTRADVNGSRMVAVHEPTAEEPALVIFLDEADVLIGDGAPPAVKDEALTLINFIASKGASEAVIMCVAAQRAVLSMIGSASIKANSFITVVLPVKTTGEMQHALPGWQDRGIPDLSTYGEGAKGVLVIETGAEWVAGRTYALYELTTVSRIALSRVKDPADQMVIAQDPDAAATLYEPPADWDDPDVDIVADPPEVVASMATVATGWPRGHLRPAATVPSLRRLRVVARDGQAVDNLLTEPGGQATAGADDGVPAVATDAEASAAATVAKAAEVAGVELGVPIDGVPHDFLIGALAYGLEAGPEGFTRAEIEEESGLAKSMTAKYLGLMINRGLLRKYGNGKSVRYFAPAPDGLTGETPVR